MHYLDLLVILGLGLLGITLIDTVGAIASRRLNFKYIHLIILSFLVYTTTGFFAGKKYDISTAISANAVLGLFDGTVGIVVFNYFKSQYRFKYWGKLQNAGPQNGFFNDYSRSAFCVNWQCCFLISL